MHHLILGYGYCGYYLAQELLKHDQQVTALSRHLNPKLQLPRLKHATHDLNQPFNWTESNTIIYYLIPPSPNGEKDIFLSQFLSHSVIKAKKVIYFGSSSVYGNHQSNWVNEQSTCFIDHSRQLRRLDAEQQWLSYCNQNKIQPILLRVAGIYGPQRLPIDAAKAQTPIIDKDRAPYTNHIYVRDLAAVTYLLTQCQTPQSLYNIADGEPKPMGTIQQEVAKAMNIKPAPYESWQHAWERASPMKREFMQGSKRLQIDRLKQSLKSSLSLTPLNNAIQQSLSK